MSIVFLQLLFLKLKISFKIWKATVTNTLKCTNATIEELKENILENLEKAQPSQVENV